MGTKTERKLKVYGYESKWYDYPVEIRLKGKWLKEFGFKKIDEKILDRVFVIAWNSIVEKRDEYVGRWKHMIEKGNPLDRIRGQQMIDLTSEGKIVKAVQEHMTMVLESMVVNEETVTVRFLDGNEKLVTGL